MKVNDKYTLVNIDYENSFYTNYFNKKTNNNVNNNIDILNTVYFTQIIKKSIINMIKNFNDIYYIDNNYLSGKILYDYLKEYYNLNLSLGYTNFKSICNILLSEKIYTYDISVKNIDNLNLYDLKYYDRKNKIKLNLYNLGHKNFIILTILGYDKTYNILLFSKKIDLINFNKVIKVNDRKKKDKLKTLFKKNRYNYKGLKKIIIRKKERTIIKGKKYSHNFNNSKNKEKNTFKRYDYIESIINDLLYYHDLNLSYNDNIEKNYYDLIDLYYNRYDLNNLEYDLINYLDTFYRLIESNHNNGYDQNYKQIVKKIKSIKTFLSVLNDYKFRINKERIDTDLINYDNYNYDISNYFLYHMNSYDKY